MADLPILFSAPMVRALIREIEQPGDGKTQTRRIIKPEARPIQAGDIIVRWGPDIGGKCERFRPRFRPGDRLWVREAWAVKRFEPCQEHERDWQSLSGPTVRYIADGAEIQHQGDRSTGRGIYHGPVESGRPSIYMPRWASRLTLYVTDVRVERLQDISMNDALSEGVELMPPSEPLCVRQLANCWYGVRRENGGYDFEATHPALSYGLLWNSINGPESWAENPWVAAYTFAVRAGNIDALPTTLDEVP